MSAPGTRRKASRTATGLACAAVLMVLASLGAAFVPAGHGHPLPSAQAAPGRMGNLDPAATTGPPATTRPAQPGSTPVAAAPHTYPPPSRVTYPPPSRVTYPAPSPATYPAPAPATYPAPSRTYPPPPPSPPKPPGWDLPPPAQLTPPLEGVVTTDVPAWDAATASRAQLAVSYVSMAAPLAPSFLHSVMRTDGSAEPVIEITPTAPGQPPLSLAQIAAGQADPWLRAMAAQIASLARPVVISFAPEPNGRWYAWGQQPAAFVQAWDHVHQVIGAGWVTWMWQVSAHNATDPATQDPFAGYWPGSSEVDWVGLDGYYYQPGDSFALRFNATLAEAEANWAGPVIIAETAVSPGLGKGMAAAVADLFSGVAADHLLGLIYFDLNVCPASGCGPYKQDFRLENSPAALAQFRQSVAGAW